MKGEIKKRVIDRLLPYRRCFVSIGLLGFYLAGNSLNNAPLNDLDVYPTDGSFAEVLLNIQDDIKESTTPNATTLRFSEELVPVQLCSFYFGGLAPLIEQFDFAHVQVGAHIRVTEHSLDVIDIEWTADWWAATKSYTTWYCGSEYPISALIRCIKYHGRGVYGDSSHLSDVLTILADIVDRGVCDRDDFKNQMDAFDLGLGDREWDVLDRLYEGLLK
jgi:hypothetical protein